MNSPLESPVPPRGKFFYGWIIAACCTLTTFINGGIFFTFSVFFKPVAGDFSWSRGEVASNYTAMLVAYAPGAFFAGKLADRYGPRRILLPAALLMGLGFIGCSQATGLAFMITSYAIVGLGLGATLALPTATIQRWFVKYQAAMVGVVHAGNGLGGLVFAPLANYLIMIHGWRTSYLIIGIVFGGVAAIAASFLVAEPGMKNLQPLRDDKQDVTPAFNPNQELKGSFSLKKAFGFGSFWGMTVLYLINFIPAFFINTHLVPYVTDKGISASIGAQGFGMMSAMSVIGRLVMSWLAGKIGWMKTLTMCYFVAAVCAVGLIFVARVETFYLFVIIYGLFWGSVLALLSGSVAYFFGLSALTELLGFLLGLGVFVGAFMPWLGGLVFDLTSSYVLAISIAAVIYTISGTIALLLKPPASTSE